MSGLDRFLERHPWVRVLCLLVGFVGMIGSQIISEDAKLILGMFCLLVLLMAGLAWLIAETFDTGPRP